MATGPKSPPKVVPIEEGKANASPAGSSKKKLFLILGLVLLVAAGAGGAFFFLGKGAAEHSPAAKKQEPPKPPIYIQMEPFTVNLQQESVEQYLQAQFTLQVSDQPQVELIKLYMPEVRNRLLLLLSSKKASELSSPDGKQKLQEEIIAAVKKPFTPQSPPQEVTGVFITSFVIQ